MSKLIGLLLLFASLSIFGDNQSTVMLKVNTKSFELSKDSSYVLRMGVSEVLTKNSYALIDEISQEEALKEQSEQREKECFDELCLVDTGKMLAAKGIFLVEIVKMGEKYIFSLKYIDIETGSTQKAKSLIFKNDINNGEELLEFSKNMTTELFSLDYNTEKNIQESSNQEVNIDNSLTTNNQKIDLKEEQPKSKKKSKAKYKGFRAKWNINFLGATVEDFSISYDEEDEGGSSSDSYAGITFGILADFVNVGTSLVDFTLLKLGFNLTTFGYFSAVTVGFASTKLKIGDARLGVSLGPLFGDMQIYFLNSNILVSIATVDFSILLNSKSFDTKIGVCIDDNGIGFLFQAGMSFNF
ncbi:hypothetical protein JXR93_12005 [bacterium]|nr:hypothetical protein [bacterium]